MDSKPLVLVTGVTGYIGSWVTLRLAETGLYRIRATMRNPDDEKKVDMLKGAFGEHFDSIELVKVDLMDKDSIFAAVEGCEIIQHVASPFPMDSPRNEDDVLVPAIQGTLAVLEAAKKYGVARVIITSSCAAINDGSKAGETIDEETWGVDDDRISTYYKSKIRAERAAWEFMDNLAESDKFDLVSINPGGVFGPFLFKGEGTSQKLITDIMTGGMPSIPVIALQFCDIRDVATAHVNAITAKPNERYAITENTYQVPDLAQFLFEEFGKYGYNITYKPMWITTIWLGSWFVKDAAFFYSMWNTVCHVKNDKSIKELNLNYIDHKTTLRDMIESLAEHGYIPNLIK